MKIKAHWDFQGRCNLLGVLSQGGWDGTKKFWELISSSPKSLAIRCIKKIQLRWFTDATKQNFHFPHSATLGLLYRGLSKSSNYNKLTCFQAQVREIPLRDPRGFCRTRQRVNGHTSSQHSRLKIPTIVNDSLKVNRYENRKDTPDWSRDKPLNKILI